MINYGILKSILIMDYGILFYKFELIFLIYNIYNYSYFVIKINFMLKFK